jgi:hypothetical protein
MAYRFAVPGIALGLFGILAALWSVAAYPAYFFILNFFGFEPLSPPFVDTHGLFSAAQCYQQGIDVYLANPCDMYQRASPYPPLWLLITPTFWGTEQTMAAGVILGLLFILSWPFVMQPRSPSETIICGLLAISPPILFAIERGNADIIIFLLVLGGGALQLAPSRYRFLSYLFFLIAGLLKYYPLVLLVLALRERWRHVLLLGAIVLATFALFGVYFRADLGYMLANIPRWSYFANSFAARNLPYGLAAFMPTGPFMSRAGLGASLLCALLAATVASTWLNLRLLARAEIDLTERGGSLLAIGSLVLTACFFAGSNMDYRGVYFLLVVPALLRLRQSGDCPILRPWLSQMIAATLFLIWEECISRGLPGLLGFHPPMWPNAQARLLLWLIREFVWWWVIAGLASIAVLYLSRLPRIRDGVADLRRRAALSLNAP